jgi:hypothetical protein
MSTMPTSIPTHPRLTREDVLDGRQVAELLHLPISTVLEYARRGLLPGCAQTWIGPEAGERLSEARFERGREVADTVVAGRAVEAIAGGAALEQAGVERIAEAKRVG